MLETDILEDGKEFSILKEKVALVIGGIEE